MVLKEKVDSPKIIEKKVVNFELAESLMDDDHVDLNLEASLMDNTHGKLKKLEGQIDIML